MKQVRDIIAKANNGVSNFLNDRKVRRVVTLSNILFSNVVPFIEKPTVWNGLKTVGSVIKAVSDESVVWPDDYFAGDEWVAPYDRGFVNMIHETLLHFPKNVIMTSDENEQIHIFDLHGIKAGITYNTQTKSIDRIYVDTQREKEAKQIIKNMLWKKYEGLPLVMAKQEPNSSLNHHQGDTVVMQHDNSRPPLPSAFATSYTDYLARALAVGINRSVLLYGPPGTGKSTIARTIINNLNLRSFRIRVEDLASFSNSLLFDAIDIFEPEAVILDDFDRCSNQSQLLETLDYFQRKVKIVVATVNDPNSLDEALKRPERFDELVYVEKMDEEIVKFMLGEYVEAYDIVKDWPITFINEYIKRRKFMTAEEASVAVQELARRVERLEKYRTLSNHIAVAGLRVDSVDDSEELDSEKEDVKNSENESVNQEDSENSFMEI